MKAKRMLSLLLTAALMLSMVTPVLAASAETELPRASQTRLEETNEVVSIRLQAAGKLVYGSPFELSVVTRPAGAQYIGVVLGGLLGAVCGYVGGRFDAIMMRVLDSIMCIPSMMMALAIVAALGSSLVNVLLAMTISNVPWYCRIIRSSVLGVTGQTYIEAARSCGTSDFQIIMTHVLPNAMGPIIVQATMGIGGAIISAAGISFVGMGIQPPAPEWGAMLNEAKTFMTMYPYMVVFPGLAIGLTALSMNLMGDGLRDALDPKLKD